MVARAPQPTVAPAPVRRFRLAVFSIGLPCQGQKRGGIEQVAHDLANALVARGHQVTVFTYDPKPTGATYDVSMLPGRGFVNSWLGRRLTMGYLANVFAVLPGYRSYDAVLAHGDSLLLPLTGRPVIRIMHGTALEEAKSATSIGRRVLQLGVYAQELLTAATQRGTVGISENTRRFNPFVRRVIPDGIDLRVFQPAAGRRSPHPTLLFVGAMGGRKRGAWMLDLFTTRIRAACPDAVLHMVSPPGPATPGVIYHTGIDREALADLYREAWLFVSPSTYEGFGLPYVESMACGTPVVATPNPGSREVLADGRYGRLVSDEAFADTVCALIGDDVERARMTRDGLTRAAEFDILSSARAYEALLEELVA